MDVSFVEPSVAMGEDDTVVIRRCVFRSNVTTDSG